MGSKNIIYGLCEEDGTVRYVGKSVSGMRRPKNHLCPSLYEKLDFPVYRWIRKRLAAGITPLIKVLAETARKEDLVEKEIEIIAGLPNLLNATAGGDGSLGRVLSAESKDKLVAANKRWQTEEKRKQISESLKKFYSANPEAKARLKETAKLASVDKEAVAKRSAEYWSRPDSRAKASAAQKLSFKNDPDRARRMAEAKKGKPLPKKRKAIIDSRNVTYSSIKEAARILGCSPSHISGALKTGKKAKNRTFTYIKKDNQ